jgi:hypothetical protein
MLASFLSCRGGLSLRNPSDSLDELGRFVHSQILQDIAYPGHGAVIVTIIESLLVKAVQRTAFLAHSALAVVWAIIIFPEQPGPNAHSGMALFAFMRQQKQPVLGTVNADLITVDRQ